MNRRLLTAIAAAVFVLAAAGAFAAEPGSRQDLQAQQADLQYKVNQAAEPAAKKPSRTGFTFIPQYLHSHNSAATTNLSDGTGGRLKTDSGHANGGGFTALATKEFNETFALSFIYMYYYMGYSGGALQPDSIPGLKVNENIDVSSHGVGLVSDINLQKFGRVQFTFVQGFDDFSGTQHSYMYGTHVGDNSMDSFSERLSTLTLWYEYDLPLTDSWSLTPYAGWRSVYAHLENQMGAADPGARFYDWVHLVSGGLKANYRSGLFGLGLRGGVNWRATGDDVPGFGVRVPAQNVGHPGFNTILDRTVASYGANVSYAIPGYCVLFGGYDGLLGSKTDSHMLSAGVMIPF